MSRRLYLDHNASTPLLPEAAAAMARAETLGNPSSIHEEGRRARAFLEDARDRVAHVLGCRPREVIFTSGATEALHLAVQGAARARTAAGRRVVVSAVEHPAVLDAAEALAPEGFAVARVAPTPGGVVDASAFVAACGPGTTVAALMAANHETGAVMPVAEVAATLRARGVITVCDAAVAVGRLDARCDALGVDLLALSAHKFGGPRGVGALFVRRRTKLAPNQRGGVQEERVRGGTENVAGAVGLAVALERAEGARVESVERLGRLREQLVGGLLSISGTELVGPRTGGLCNTATISFDGCEGEALLVNLDLEGVAVSTGSACAVGGTEASPVLLAMGLPPRKAASTLRMSLGDGLDASDVERVRAVVAAVVARLRALAR
jgi:cysteine desulfurase